jgi:hypothetical protein
MKTLNALNVICLVLGLVACTNNSNSSGGSQVSQTVQSAGLNGSWIAASDGDILTIAANGTISSTVCGDQGTITNITPLPSSGCPSGFSACGTGTIDLTFTNGTGGCQPVGVTNCAYAVSSNTLEFNCGNGFDTYQATGPYIISGQGVCYDGTQTVSSSFCGSPLRQACGGAVYIYNGTAATWAIGDCGSVNCIGYTVYITPGGTPITCE